MTEWDGLTYCTNRDGRPGEVRVLVGMVDTTPLYEIVCYQCALTLHLETHGLDDV